MKTIARIILLLLTVPVFAQGPAPAPDKPSIRPARPVHTYSIVARDPKTGEIGVAVQSHWFCVGCIVSWAEAGVGAVATQSFVDPAYGKLGLDLMRAGKSAPKALGGLVAADLNKQVRQVAMIDNEGRVGAFTGCRDIPMAGHRVGTGGGKLVPILIPDQDSECEGRMDFGRNYSVQANLMLNDKVWPAMAEAFERAQGDLADRMLAALEAAEEAGGDIRGRQSAALIVVSGKSTGRPWVDRTFDLRVDDHPEPLKELRLLVKLQRAYNHMNAGDLAVEQKDNEAALRAYSAAEALFPDDAEMIYWHAVALVNMGRVEDALPKFARVFALDENWRTLTPRLPRSGLLPDDKQLIDRIVRQGRTE
jgi:uncharacterized Ntn-hydrolase superfamily protein